MLFDWKESVELDWIEQNKLMSCSFDISYLAFLFMYKMFSCVEFLKPVLQINQVIVNGLLIILE